MTTAGLIFIGCAIAIVLILVGAYCEARRHERRQNDRNGDYMVYKVGKGEKR